MINITSSKCKIIIKSGTDYDKMYTHAYPVNLLADNTYTDKNNRISCYSSITCNEGRGLSVA